MDVDEVVRSIEEVVAADPRNHLCRSLLARARMLARRRHVEDVARSAADLVAAVDRAVAVDDLQTARTLLDEAPPDVATRSHVRRLRQRLAELMADHLDDTT